MFPIFRTNQPFFFIISTWIILIINGLFYFNHDNPTEFGFIIYKLIGLPKLLLYFIVFFIVFYTGFLINIFVNRSVLFEKSYYIPGILYVILITSFGDLTTFLLPLIGNLFLVLALRNLLHIYRSDPCKKQVFNASVFILLSAGFYAMNLFVLPLIWLVLLIIRPFVWREYFMPLVILIIAFAYVLPFGIINGDLSDIASVWWSSSLYSFHEISPVRGLMFLSFISLLFLLSFRPVVSTFVNSNNRYKRVIWVIVAMTASTLSLGVIDFFLFNRSFGGLIPFLVPLVIFLSNGFIRSRIQWTCDIILVLYFVYNCYSISLIH